MRLTREKRQSHGYGIGEESIIMNRITNVQIVFQIAEMEFQEDGSRKEREDDEGGKRSLESLYVIIPNTT